MTDIDLYDIVRALNTQGAPLVFKGALALQPLLDEFNVRTGRKTKDIDATLAVFSWNCPRA